MLNEPLMSEAFTFRDLDELNETFHAKGWSDGLPIVPPTKDRVLAMIAAAGRSARDVIARIPPRWADATVENIAVNAAMAGCRPEYMPLLVTAVEAMCEEVFGLYSVQATTHPCGVMILASGPIVRQLEIPTGYGMFGPGFRASASIGRAMRLILRNVGGGMPGDGDQSTQGSPAKFAYCFGENDEATPDSWELHRVAQGFAREDSTVTVVAAEGPHNVNDHVCVSGLRILNTVATTMATLGHNNSGGIGEGDVMVVVGPEHAEQIAGDGLSRADVQNYLFENARTPIHVHRDSAMWEMSEWPRWIDKHNPDYRVPIVEKPEDIHIVVSGGAGKHSAFIPTFGLQKSVTRRIPPMDY